MDIERIMWIEELFSYNVKYKRISYCSFCCFVEIIKCGEGNWLCFLI